MDEVSSLRPYQPHEQRVVDEMNALAVIVGRLREFIEESPLYWKLSGDEQWRLRRQLNHMRDYLGVLDERVRAFS